LIFPIILCLLFYSLACACGFACFIIFNNLSNNKLLDQDPQWVHEASLEFQCFSVNEEVPEKIIINTKTGVPRSPEKPRFPGAKAPKEYN
jgi:hypothetical protein